MRIIKEHSAALIIDVQQRLFPVMQNQELLLSNMTKLIQGLKILEVPVLLTQQYTKGLGNTIPELLPELAGIDAIEKMSFSCCDERGFMDKLNALSRLNVIIAGIESHVCVLQTVLDLIDYEYQPVVVQDCISSRKENDMAVALHRMRQEGAIITTSESLLLELARFAGTEQFKTISKLIR